MHQTLLHYFSYTPIANIYRQKTCKNCFFLLLLLAFFTINANAEEISTENNTIGGDFELTSHLNQPYSLVNSRGKVVILFFGFTHCPDVCPSTLGSVQTALSQLGTEADKVDTLMITVDPKRDSPKILEEYMEYFHSSFIGLTGELSKIDEVVKKYNGFYSYSKNETSYDVDHTSNLYLIDPQGEVANIIPYGLPASIISENIKKLLPASDAS